MANTHINAFFADVDEAEKRVLEAHADWEAAKLRLEAKKKEVGFEETTIPETETKSEDLESAEEPRSGNSIFGRKK